MINLICNKLFILAPIYFRQQSGGSSLIITTIVFTLSLILWNFYCNVYKTTTNNLIAGKLSVVVMLVISILVTAATITQYSLALKSTVLKQTPLDVVSFIFIAAMMTGAISSLKSIATAGRMFVPIIYFVALLLVLMSVDQNDIYNFFPIIDIDINEIIPQFMLMLSMLFETIFLYFLPDIVENTKDLRVIGNKSILWSYACFLIIGVVCSITLSNTGSINGEPFFRMIRLAHLGTKSANFDSVFLILYCISAYLYLSSMLVLLNKTTNLVFRSRVAKYMKFVIVVLIVVFSLSNYLYNAIFELFSKNYAILFVVTFIIPLILSVTEKVKKCKSKI